MLKLYKGCFFVYRITLVLLVISLLFNNIKADAPRHNIDYDIPDLVLVIFGLITTTLIWQLQRPGINISLKRTVQYVVATFVFASIFFEIYFLYYTFFVCRCFSGGDIFITILLVLFTVMTAISFLALVKNKI
jgi:hypothetical protein